MKLTCSHMLCFGNTHLPSSLDIEIQQPWKIRRRKKCNETNKVTVTTEITTKSATATQEAAITEGEENQERRQRRPTARPHKELRKMWKRLSTYILRVRVRWAFVRKLYSRPLFYCSIWCIGVSLPRTCCIRTGRIHTHTLTHTHIRPLTGSRYYKRAREPPKYFHLQLRTFVLAAFCIHSLRVRLGVLAACWFLSSQYFYADSSRI